MAPAADSPNTGSSNFVSSVSVRELVEATSTDAPAPGGGAVSGVAAALAAALAGMAGRYAVKRSPESDVFPKLVERADAIAARALALGDEDAVAYSRYMEATRLPREPDPEPRRQAVRRALDAASEVPLELARLAVEVAAAGEELATSGNPNLLADAATATFLASAAAAGASLMVSENLHRSRPEDPRIVESARCAAEAWAASERLMARFGHP